jgi:hypothetical protein
MKRAPVVNNAIPTPSWPAPKKSKSASSPSASDKVGVLHPGAALEIRTVPNHEMFKNSKGFSAPLGRRTVAGPDRAQPVSDRDRHGRRLAWSGWRS